MLMITMIVMMTILWLLLLLLLLMMMIVTLIMMLLCCCCASTEDVFVDVTWSVCISIKQFNIEFKVRSHLGNTNFYHIHLYNLTRFSHFYFLYVSCVISLITFACLTKIVLI